MRIVEIFKSILSNHNNIRISNDSLIKTRLLRGATIYGNVFIDVGVRTFPDVRIDAQSFIKVGKYTSINGPGTEICSLLNNVEIGSYCSIARQVSIQEYNHNYLRPSSSTLGSRLFKENKRNDVISNGPIIIGNDVWIGSKVTVLSGVKIGNGAIIAANSVVSRDVLPFSIVGGVPAKLLKMRFEDHIIERLESIKWWEWDESKISQNRDFFLNTLDPSSFDRIK